MNDEMKKVFNDVKDRGLGIYDNKLNKHIDIENLSFYCQDQDGTGELKEEILLHRSLYQIEKIFEKKFKNDKNPYDIKLYKKNPELFMERLIRATEICALRYVLNKNGALNISEKNFKKIGTRFTWD